MADQESGPRFTEQQKAAIEAKDALHVVSAGAGSGKTTVIVERILRLAEQGEGPDRLLAITFTEKGAAELKRRLVTAFEEAGRESERRDAEAAYISTIHGFCARILREWPVEARVDPGFGILDPIEEAIFHEEQLEALYRDDEFARLLQEYGTAWNADQPELFRMVRGLIAAWREKGVTVEELRREADPERLVERALEEHRALLAEEWARMLELLAGADRLTDAEYVGGQSGKKYASLCQFVRELTPDEPRWGLAEELWQCIGFYAHARKKEKPQWQEALEPARDVAARFRGYDPATAEDLEREAARRRAAIMGWAADVWQAYDEFKAERNLLDYQDLQLLALRLLRQSDTARDAYRTRFRNILLDEAQDTNPLQYDILRELWTGKNRWFVVGDPKQAIYGFRTTDLDLFLDLVEEAEGVTELPDNFRSREEVLDAVNAAGHAFWDQEPRLRFFELRAGLPYPCGGAGPRVEATIVEQRTLPEEEPGTHETVADAREREARWVADRLLTLKQNERLLDRKSGGLRPFRWSDAAILLRTRTGFAPFERAFQDAGIPYVTAGSLGFFDGLEVQDLLNGLAVAVNPLDDARLIAALRSPLCGISDDALVRLRMELEAGERNGFWEVVEDGLALPDRDAERLERFTGVVHRLRDVRGVVRPADALDMLLTGTDYVARLEGGTRAEARAANVRRLVTFAESHPEHSLQQFLRHAVRAARHLRDEVDAVVADPDADVVRISTVHGAKGLEWPVVFLADLCREYWRSAKHSGVTSDGQLVLAVAEDPTASKTKWLRPWTARPLLERLDAAAMAEAQRLLYVGMTRARERLVLSGAAKRGARAEDELKRPVHWLRGRLELEEWPPEDEDTAGEGGTGGEGENGVATLQREWGQAEVTVRWVGEEWERAERRPRVPEDEQRAEPPVAGNGTEPDPPTPEVTQPPVKLLPVTRLAGFLRCPLVFRFSELGLTEFARGGGGVDDRAEPEPDDEEQAEAVGAALGDLVHEALERADFDADPTAEAARLAPGSARARAMVEKVLRSSLAEEIRRAVEIRREVPFYLPLGDGRAAVLHGIIDLAFRDGEGDWHVVDWKTNAIHDELRLRTLVDQHSRQVRLYAAALSRMDGAGVASGRLVYLARNLAADGVQPVDVGEAEQERTLTTAAHAASRIGAARYETMAGPKCEGCGYRRGGWCHVGREWKVVTA
ncbi:MAG: UvrD-helicase domain-containing protein [Gemmatimonadota bacterium]